MSRKEVHAPIAVRDAAEAAGPVIGDSSTFWVVSVAIVVRSLDDLLSAFEGPFEAPEDLEEEADADASSPWGSRLGDVFTFFFFFNIPRSNKSVKIQSSDKQ